MENGDRNNNLNAKQKLAIHNYVARLIKGWLLFLGVANVIILVTVVYIFFILPGEVVTDVKTQVESRIDDVTNIIQDLNSRLHISYEEYGKVVQTLGTFKQDSSTLKETLELAKTDLTTISENTKGITNELKTLEQAVRQGEKYSNDLIEKANSISRDIKTIEQVLPHEKIETLSNLIAILEDSTDTNELFKRLAKFENDLEQKVAKAEEIIRRMEKIDAHVQTIEKGIQQEKLEMLTNLMTILEKTQDPTELFKKLSGFEKELEQKVARADEIIKNMETIDTNVKALEHTLQQKDQQASEIIDRMEIVDANVKTLEQAMQQRDKQTSEIINRMEAIDANIQTIKQATQQKGEQSTELISKIETIDANIKTIEQTLQQTKKDLPNSNELSQKLLAVEKQLDQKVSKTDLNTLNEEFGKKLLTLQDTITKLLNAQVKSSNSRNVPQPMPDKTEVPVTLNQRPTPQPTPAKAARSLKPLNHFAIIGSFKDLNDALKFAQKIQAAGIKYPVEVYLAVSGYYAVTLGGYLDRKDAIERVKFAKAHGIASDAYFHPAKQSWGDDLFKTTKLSSR